MVTVLSKPTDIVGLYKVFSKSIRKVQTVTVGMTPGLRGLQNYLM
jgi:hypothetical protein